MIVIDGVESKKTIAAVNDTSLDSPIVVIVGTRVLKISVNHAKAATHIPCVAVP